MESPYKEILIFVCGGGLITAIIAVSKEVRERVAEKKKQKQSEIDTHISTTVERQRIENESDDAAWTRLNEENKRLTAELRELRESPSLSMTTKTYWYKCYRELGIKIDKHETRIARETPHQSLLDSLGDLKRKYDELGEKMP